MADTPFLRLPVSGMYRGEGAGAAASNPKMELDRIALDSGVPANVILAMAETAGVTDAGQIVDFAKQTAGELGPRIKAGESVEAIIRQRFNDPAQADAFINRAYDIADQYYPAKPKAAEEKPEGGMGAALSSGIDSLQQGFGSAIEGVGRVTGMEGVEKLGAGIAERNAREAEENGAGLTQWNEVDGVGSAAKFTGEVAAQNAPQLGLSMAGGFAGAAAGAAAGSFIPVIGTVAGAIIGGLMGGMSVNLPLFYGQNRERQKEAIERGIKTEIDEGAAFLSALPQAALDSVVDRFIVGKFLHPSALNAGGLLTRAGKNAATGAMTEIPTEIGQQMIERAQAGLPLDDDEAINEYISAGIAAGILGGGVGGVSGAIASDSRAAGGDTPPGTPPAPLGPMRAAMNEAASAAPIPANTPLRDAAMQAPPTATGLRGGQPIEVVTPDGVRIPGAVIKETPLSLTIANESGELIEIPRADIESGAVRVNPVATPDTLAIHGAPAQAEPGAATALIDGADSMIKEGPASDAQELSRAAEDALDFLTERAAIIEEGEGLPREQASMAAAAQTLPQIERLAARDGWDDSLFEIHDTLSDLLGMARIDRQAKMNEASKLPEAATQAPEAAPAPEVGVGVMDAAEEVTQPQAEPPRKDGFVRVYHSGSKGEGDTSRWVSTDKKYASDYRADLPLFYTDIPKDDPRVTPEYENQGVDRGFTFNFELTPQEAASLSEITRDTAPQIGETPAAPAQPGQDAATVAPGADTPVTRPEAPTLPQAAPDAAPQTPQAADASAAADATAAAPEAPAQAGKSGVDYPNRKLNMRYAAAEKPIDGIGDSDPVSLGGVALANARDGDKIPGHGTVTKVTEKQIQITGDDGNVKRISANSEKFISIARDLGDLIGASANLNPDQVGSLLDMIERDPALVYRNGVPQLFDDAAEQANRGERGMKASILKPLVDPAPEPAPEPAPAPAPEPESAPELEAVQGIAKPLRYDSQEVKDRLPKGYSVEVQDTDVWGFYGPNRKQFFPMGRTHFADSNPEDHARHVEQMLERIAERAAKNADEDLDADAAQTPEPEAPSDAAKGTVYNASKAAIDAGTVTHTTKRGKDLTGYIVRDITPGQAKAIDKYAFRKDGGWFIRADDLKAAHPALFEQAVVADDATTDQAQTVADAAQDANPEPTPAQAEAGNYKMGHKAWNGLSLTIETAKGEERKKVADDGKVIWSVPSMPAHYGYFKRTEGADGDHVDFYMGDVEDSDYVLIVDQAHADTGKFDEHKVIIGTTARGAALDIYRAGFSDGKANDRLGGFHETNVAGLKAWLESGDMSKPTKPMDFPFKMKQAPQDVTVRTVNGRRYQVTRVGDKTSIMHLPAPIDGVAQDGVMLAEPQAGRSEAQISDIIAKHAKDQEATEQGAAPAPEPAPEPAEKLEDFGKVIGGARKHIYEAKRREIARMMDLDIEGIDWSTAGLNDVLPMPDFAKLDEEGEVNRSSLFVVAAMRAAIPNKNGVHFTTWKDHVLAARTHMIALLEGKADLKDVVAENSNWGQAFGPDRIGKGNHLSDRIEKNPSVWDDLYLPLFERIAPENMMDVANSLKFGEEFTIVQDIATKKRSKVATGKIAVHAEPRAYSPWNYTRIVDTVQQAAELANGWAEQRRKRMAEVRAENAENYDYGFEVVEPKNTFSKDVYIYTTRPKRVQIMRFPSKSAADAFMETEEGMAEIRQIADELRNGFEERRRDNASRVGPSWRNGKDITAKEFAETFGVSEETNGIQFGNSMTDKERTAALNSAYDGFMDLAAVLGVAPKSILLNGKLSVAFGARGKGGKNPAAAHYEPGQVIINLTRKNGAGSLAHEWFHALDNFLARQDALAGGTPARTSTPNAQNIRLDYMSARRRRYGMDDKMPGALYEAFVALRAAFEKSGYLHRMERSDKMKASRYWSDNIEMGARSFEAWVLTNLRDRGMSHDYLVNVIKDDGGALPNLKERAQIFPIFTQIMAQLHALDQFKADGDVPSIPELNDDSELHAAKVGMTFNSPDGEFVITAVTDADEDNYATVTVKDPRNGGKPNTLKLTDYFALRGLMAYALTEEGRAEAKAAELEAMRRAEAAAMREAARAANKALLDRFRAENPHQQFAIGRLSYGYFSGDDGNPATFIMNMVRDHGYTVWSSGRSEFFGKQGGVYYKSLDRGVILFAKWARRVVDEEAAMAAVTAAKAEADAKSDEEKYGTAFDAGFDELFGPDGDDTGTTLTAEEEAHLFGKGDPVPEEAPTPPEGATDDADGDIIEPISPEVTRPNAPTFSPDGSKPTIKGSASDAVKHAAAGIKESMTALNTIFGPKMNRLNSGLAWDDETYAQALPHFKRAYREFGSAATSLVDLAKALIEYMVRNGLDRAVIGSMRPYFIRFMKDVDTKAIDPWAEDAAPVGGDVKAMSDAFFKALNAGEKFKTINAARRMASEAIGRKLEDADLKVVEEAMELALVRASRVVVAKGGDKAETFDALTALYEAQPILAQRTGDSVRRQAYSTPAPLAYLASELAEIDGRTTVYEPTAGNGMLLIGADPKNVTANELDADRASRLRDALGDGATITVGSALDVAGPEGVDVVIENPPFGKLLIQDTDKATEFGVPFGKGGKTTEIDHAIVAKSLESMADDGKAVLIVGGQKGDSQDARKAGYRGAGRAFWNWLYDNYNVTEHFTVSGDLYKRQGAAWPVDVIVIEGRGASKKLLPMAEAPSFYSDWAQLKGRADGTQSTLDPRGERDGGRDGGDPTGGNPDLAGVSGEGGNAPSQVDGGSGNAQGGTNADGSVGGRGGDATLNGRPDAEKPGGNGRGDAGAVGNPAGESGPQVDGENRPAAGGEPRGDAGVQSGDAGGVAGKRDRGASDRVNNEQETSLQVQYAPRSTAGFAVGTLVPKNMQTAMNNALDAISAEVGDIDEFVARELGYDVNRMLFGDKDAPGYFSAEQVDAIALSIYNIKKGGGFIIGDQTGVGKGRVVAAMMRWAEKNGRIPVFVTAKPGLYNAMVGDMRDIGWDGDPTGDTMITNRNMRGKDALDLDSGGTLQSLGAKPMKEAMGALLSGQMPKGVKRIFTTYSQMQSVKGGETDRRRALRAIAPKALFILDESHLAGGPQNAPRLKDGQADLSRATFMRELLDASEGAFYSSATFAKSPTVMSLYGKTDLRLAVEDLKNLGDVIEKGGVPMQQAAANMLVEAGQYVRRERSYAGVKFETSQYKTNMEAATEGTAAIRQVFDIDRDVMQDVRASFIEEMQSEGHGNATDNAVGEESASSVNFSSIMHNVVSQFITALKADEAANRVIAAIKDGKKPIIALSNTNESIINDFTEGSQVGDTVGDVPFNTILLRYLDRLRRITITDKNTDKKRHVFLTDADIIKHGGAEALAMFYEAKKTIEKMDLSGIPGSPLDYILDKVESAGYKMGEITGRGVSVRKGVVTGRETSAAAKNRSMRAYNNGDADALIINKSGAEGFSLHATGKNGNDGKPRMMIILQPDPDINVFMQLIGRIHRTGQIKLPEYEIAISELAVEKRPAAVLMRKMASLSANTTANKDSAVELSAVDFMNKYGDRIVRQYLLENRDMAAQLDIDGLIESAKGDEDGEVSDGGNFAAKATGRMAILDPAIAERAFADIEENYTAMIEELDRSGNNDLEAKALDLEAKTKSSVNITQGVKDSVSPFAAPAKFEVVNVKTFGKPMTSTEVLAAVAEGWGDGGNIRTWRAKMYQEIGSWIEPAQARFDEAIAVKTKELEKAKTEKAKDRIRTALFELAERKAAIRQAALDIQSALHDYAVGRPLTITPRDNPDTLINGVVIGVDWSKAVNNPMARSKIAVRIAIAAPEREVRMPLSMLLGEASPYAVTFFENTERTAKLFDNVPRETREDRAMITGNLIAGFEKFPKGRIVMFTRDDGSKDTGILLPRNFNLQRELENMPVAFASADQVMKFVATPVSEPDASFVYYPMVETSDGVVKITRNSRGVYGITIRSKGGKKYVQHSIIKKVFGELNKRGSNDYEASIYSADDLESVVAAFMKDLGASFTAASYKDKAREIIGQPKIDMGALKDDGTRESRMERIGPRALGPVAEKAQAELAASGLAGKVTAKVVRGLINAAGVEIQGLYRKGMIAVNTASRDAIHVMRHEIVHALRDDGLWGTPYGLFSKDEWQALVRYARADKDLVRRVNDVYGEFPQSIIAEELVAEKYAEWRDERTGASGPALTAFEKIRSFFRALASALRGEGFVDAAAVFEKIASGTIGDRGPQGPGGGQPRDAQGRFSKGVETMESRFIPPALSAFKTDSERNKAEGSFISNLITDMMGGKGDGTNLLALVPGEPLFAELGKRIPSAQTYLRLKHELGAVRNDLQAKADTILQDWRKVMSGKGGKEHNAAMADLMHDATLAGIDPAIAHIPPKRLKDETQSAYKARLDAHRDRYDGLRVRFLELPTEFRAIYKTVRDEYKAFADETDKAVLANIEKAMGINLERAHQKYGEAMQRITDDGLEGEAYDEAVDRADRDLREAKIRFGWGKAARLQSLRLQMEAGRVDGPYFPLVRFGNYFVTVRDKQTARVLSFSKFESAAEQKRFAAEMREDDNNMITVGVMDAPGQLRNAVDPNFVADVEMMVGNAVQDESLADEIWQRYLETLPDFSMRKSRMHRKGTAGFSNDAFRVFGRQMFHGAHQLARLKYGLEMQQAVNNAKKEADISEDPNRSRLIVNEMERRHQFTMNPKGSAWSTWATSAAFVYYLGMTPAAALVNLSQTTVVGIPVMSASIKGATIASASRHIMRASRDFMAGKAHISNSKRLTADERAAMAEAYRRGTIDKSQSHDLAGIAEAGVEYSDVRARMMKPISFLFHHTERANREVTFLAAYRMARESGLDHAEAIETGSSVTWKTHFNYEADARPRLLQQDWLRVMMVFRSYQINVLYRLFRDLHQSLKGKSQEERREARRQLIGITASMMFHAGFRGVWGYALLTTILGMFSEGGSDEVEEEIKEAVVGLFGQDIGGIILNGAPGHILGIDLTHRLGMPELWFRKPDRQLEGKEEFSYWVEQMLGAVPGMAASVHRGVGLALDGNIYRGVETAAPKFVRDIMKSGRYLADGVTTTKGDSILDDVSPAQAFKQALGFSPAQISERYEMNGRRMNENERIEGQRSDILSKITTALRKGDPITEEMTGQIRAFNSAHPMFAITADTIKTSFKSRLRSSQRIEDGGGVPINPKLAREIDEKFKTRIYD